MAKYLTALLGATFIVVAAGLSHAQTPRGAQQGATANEPMMETRGEGVTKKSTRKAKKAKTRSARRAMGMGMGRRVGMGGQPTPPGTDRAGGASDQQSAKPKMDRK